MKIPAIARWCHWRLAYTILSEYSPKSIVDLGGVGRLKNFVSCKVTDANLKHGIDATKLPYKDRSFDIAVSINTLEHVKKKVKFIKESIRVSRIAVYHWVPSGEAAEATEKLKRKLGHKHPCKLPTFQDFEPFRKDDSVRFVVTPAGMSCKEHLLLLASMKEKLNKDEVFEFISKYGEEPYSYLFKIVRVK